MINWMQMPPKNLERMRINLMLSWMSREDIQDGAGYMQVQRKWQETPISGQDEKDSKGSSHTKDTTKFSQIFTKRSTRIILSTLSLSYFSTSSPSMF